MRFWLGFLVVVALLFGAAVARADEPQFGACWREGKTCIGPRVAAPALAIDLETGNVQAGVLPGFGYGVEVRAKLQYGVSVLMNLHDTAEGNRLAPALMFDFMRYVHTGPMRELGGDGRWYWLITLGTDLGSAPAR